MERSASDPLQCPRCSSSNTKFCYYNNYNLSQPRHFCKACKRYWTRGGTLRNVPVGGACRKYKKFKRHPPSNGGGGDGFPSVTESTTATIKPFTDLPAPSSSHINKPFFSSFPTELNFPFSVIRASAGSPRFDDLPRIACPGSGFSPDYRNPLFDQNIQDHANFTTFGSSSFSPSSTMASFLAQQQRFAACNEFPSSTPYEGTDMVVGNEEIGKESKIFEGEIRSNQIEQINSSSSSFLWNPSNVGVWFDPSSSVPSLI